MSNPIQVIKLTTVSGSLDGKADVVHTHELADITDAGTAAASNVGDFATAAQGALADTAIQAGTLASVNADISDATLIDTTDPRLSDARTPTTHTHTLSDVTDSGTAAALDVPAVGDAGVGEVVKGNDSRLTDDRDPTAHTHPVSELTDAGTAATYDVPASGDAAAGELVKGDDTRLTNARTPTAHTHTEAEISDLGATVTLNSDADVSSNTWVLAEDDFISASGTKVPTQLSVKNYVASNTSSFKGNYNASTNVPNLDSTPSAGTIFKGDMYTVTADGTFYTTAIKIGDVLISEVDDPSSLSDWTLVSRVLDASDIRDLGFFDITNDGTGSGLDADLLDGNEATAFATAAQGALTVDAMHYKGNYNAATNTPDIESPQAGEVIKGDLYYVSVAGSFFFGQPLAVGDLLVSKVDDPSLVTDWIIFTQIVSTDLVTDLTPQLGGDLDVNGSSIVSTANGDINLTPNGTGNVAIGSFVFNADQVVGPSEDNYVLTYDDATGFINLEASSGGGVDDTAYGVSWNGDTTTAASKNAIYDKIETLGGLNNVVEDLTPQLGGNLDVNGKAFTSASATSATFDFQTSSGYEALKATFSGSYNGFGVQISTTSLYAGTPTISVFDHTGSGFYGHDLQINSLNAVSTTGVFLDNYKFKSSETVGAGQDQQVLTYDHGTQRILLQAAQGVDSVHTETAASYTAGTNSETIILADASSNAMTVNLPAAASNTDAVFYIKKVDSSANTVTIDGNSTELIDDTQTKIISDQYISIKVVCDGTQWWII